ncbi:unnamed protein product [Protopolystoma xenopodis]|uniref:Uncharacterized protein n=1 Tax=Protopolystoma xenopodis TaxID=117903 RepID=A0A448WSL2_9PLAT|nr:unnamed protein product [Protopolystoma xenopodis]
MLVCPAVPLAEVRPMLLTPALSSRGVDTADATDTATKKVLRLACPSLCVCDSGRRLFCQESATSLFFYRQETKRPARLACSSANVKTISWSVQFCVCQWQCGRLVGVSLPGALVLVDWHDMSRGLVKTCQSELAEEAETQGRWARSGSGR